MLFQFQSTLLVLFIFAPLLSFTRILPSPSPSAPFPPSHKFDNARTPNVHGFYAIHGVYGARIDRSRDSFSQGGGRKRTATTFGRMADRETKRNRSRPFNVSALSSVIYHRAYITVAGSRNFAFFFFFLFLSFPPFFFSVAVRACGYRARSLASKSRTRSAKHETGEAARSQFPQAPRSHRIVTSKIIITSCFLRLYEISISITGRPK